MVTSILLFLPIAGIFLLLVIHGQLATPLDWGAGIVLGIALNYLGIIKLIDLLKNKATRYIFPKRFFVGLKPIGEEINNGSKECRPRFHCGRSSADALRG